MSYSYSSLSFHRDFISAGCKRWRPHQFDIQVHFECGQLPEQRRRVRSADNVHEHPAQHIRLQLQEPRKRLCLTGHFFVRDNCQGFRHSLFYDLIRDAF